MTMIDRAQDRQEMSMYSVGTPPQKSDHKIDMVAIKLLMSIRDKWKLTDEEVASLAGVAVPQIEHWREALAGGSRIALPEAVRMKVSCLASIYKWRRLAVQSSCSDSSWVRQENPDLQGSAPIEYLVSGSDIDLIALKQYLQGWSETPYL